MPGLKPNQLAASAEPPSIFVSAASDPPIPRTSRRMRVAGIAMAIAAVIWLWLAMINLGPSVPVDLLLMAIVGALLDGLVALELWQQRWSRTVLIYVAVRTFVAAAGFTYLCLPVYVVALIAVPTSSPFAVKPDPDVAHAFQTRRNWIASMLPIRFGANVATDGSAMCVCGKPRRDEVHDPAAR